MAQVVNVDKKNPPKPSPSAPKAKENKAPLFRKMNYILMIVGVLLLAIGYILLAGGKAPADAEFSDAIFNARRMVIAPTMILAGLVVGIVAIMYHPRVKKNDSSLTGQD